MENCTHKMMEMLTEMTESSSLVIEFVIYGVLMITIGLFGIVVNIISMIILSRPQMKSSINYLLIGLARCDTVLIVTSFLLFSFPSIYKYTDYMESYFEIFPFLVIYVFPIAMIAQTISVYLTLTVTLERFIAVCLPLRARSLCTYGRARIYVIVIVIFSILYNLVRFWEWQLCLYEVNNSTIYFYETTEMRRNKMYISVYINWCYFIFMYVLPFTCIAVLNGAIYMQVRRANAERQRLSRLQRREIGLAMMLLCVVAVFFVCNVLALVNNLLECFSIYLPMEMVELSNLLITINSSVNFVIYVIFGEKFKRLFLKMFCGRHGWLLAAAGAPGRESPDGGTHDDSVVSNGDGRTYSMRSVQLQRSSTKMAHGSRISRGGGGGGGKSSVSAGVAPAPPACAFYAAGDRQPQIKPSTADRWEQTTSTELNEL